MFKRIIDFVRNWYFKLIKFITGILFKLFKFITGALFKLFKFISLLINFCCKPSNWSVKLWNFCSKCSLWLSNFCSRWTNWLSNFCSRWINLLSNFCSNWLKRSADTTCISFIAVFILSNHSLVDFSVWSSLAHTWLKNTSVLLKNLSTRSSSFLLRTDEFTPRKSSVNGSNTRVFPILTDVKVDAHANSTSNEIRSPPKSIWVKLMSRNGLDKMSQWRLPPLVLYFPVEAFHESYVEPSLNEQWCDFRKVKIPILHGATMELNSSKNSHDNSPPFLWM